MASVECIAEVPEGAHGSASRSRRTVPPFLTTFIEEPTAASITCSSIRIRLIFNDPELIPCTLVKLFSGIFFNIFRVIFHRYFSQVSKHLSLIFSTHTHSQATFHQNTRDDDVFPLVRIISHRDSRLAPTLKASSIQCQLPCGHDS